jgi:hypothetical protein
MLSHPHSKPNESPYICTDFGSVYWSICQPFLESVRRSHTETIIGPDGVTNSYPIDRPFFVSIGIAFARTFDWPFARTLYNAFTHALNCAFCQSVFQSDYWSFNRPVSFSHPAPIVFAVDCSIMCPICLSVGASFGPPFFAAVSNALAVPIFVPIYSSFSESFWQPFDSTVVRAIRITFL